MINKKKGFTLIEIIISISLILIFGTSATVMFVNNNSDKKKLDEMSDEIYTAVHLLVETNEGVKKQLYNNKNGVIVPLVKLENEGLIDFGDLDIDDEYVLTMLGDTDGADACSGNLYDIGTWTKSSDDIIYICGNPNVSTGDVKETLTLGDGYYIAKGENPNNWVKFDVTTDTSKAAYFSTDSSLEDLWRIHSIDNDGKIKLVYNDVVNTDVETIYSLAYDYVNDSYDPYNFYELNEYYDVYSHTLSESARYYAMYHFEGDNIWNVYDLMDETKGKKRDLLDQIQNINLINTENYKIYYTTSNAESENIYIDYENTNHPNLKLGLISYTEYLETFLFNNSWLNFTFLLGTGDVVNCAQALGVRYGTYIRSNNYEIYDTRIHHYDIYGYPYLPAIVLKNKVELKVDSSCSNAGSKECPYLLECSEC